MTSPDWISLECTPTTLVRLLPDLAGGLTLQLLTATEQAGQTFVLPVKAAESFKQWVLDAFFPSIRMQEWEKGYANGRHDALRERREIVKEGIATTDFDAMAALLHESGYGVFSPPLTAEDAPVLRSMLKQLERNPPAPCPAPTVLEACLKADMATQGLGMSSIIRQILGELGIPPQAPYTEHAAALANRYPERWPDTTKAVSHAD